MQIDLFAPVMHQMFTLTEMDAQSEAGLQATRMYLSLVNHLMYQNQEGIGTPNQRELGVMVDARAERRLNDAVTAALTELMQMGVFGHDIPGSSQATRDVTMRSSISDGRANQPLSRVVLGLSFKDTNFGRNSNGEISLSNDTYPGGHPADFWDPYNGGGRLSFGHGAAHGIFNGRTYESYAYTFYSPPLVTNDGLLCVDPTLTAKHPSVIGLPPLSVVADEDRNLSPGALDSRELLARTTSFLSRTTPLVWADFTKVGMPSNLNERMAYVSNSSVVVTWSAQNPVTGGWTELKSRVSPPLAPAFTRTQERDATGVPRGTEKRMMRCTFPFGLDALEMSAKGWRVGYKYAYFAPGVPVSTTDFSQARFVAGGVMEPHGLHGVPGTDGKFGMKANPIILRGGGSGKEVTLPNGERATEITVIVYGVPGSEVDVGTVDSGNGFTVLGSVALPGLTSKVTVTVPDDDQRRFVRLGVRDRAGPKDISQILNYLGAEDAVSKVREWMRAGAWRPVKPD